MSPTSYPLLHPAIYFVRRSSIFFLTTQNLCPPLGGYEPNELPTAPPRDIFYQKIFYLLFNYSEPVSAARRI
jgi:hypothetical protein